MGMIDASKSVTDVVAACCLAVFESGVITFVTIAAINDVESGSPKTTADTR